jgi:hypothetical protein
MAGMVERIWERLREAYEAQLVRDARYDFPKGDPRRVRLSSAEVAHVLVPGTYLRGAVRGPRPLRGLGLLLRPQVLQFGLPMALLSLGARVYHVAHGGSLVWPGLVFGLGVTFLFSLAFHSWFGDWLFSRRWERLRTEAYQRWQWRAVAEAEMLEAVTREPRRLPDDASPRPGSP